MNCGLCGSTINTLLWKAGKHQIVKCGDCGLIYNASFAKGETSYLGDDYFTCKNQYVSRWEDFCAKFESLLDNVMRFKRAGTLLDVGTGCGALLSVAARRGFIAQGVEVSEWASSFAREAKGLDVLTGTLEEARFETEVFDIVIINHVLEHIFNPRGILTEVHRILKNDGLLVIGVPNIGSIMASLRGGKWESLRPEEHIWHFTHATLERLVAEIGFIELYFEARKNHPATGWRPKALLRKAINSVAVLANRSEAMLLFAGKGNSLAL